MNLLSLLSAHPVGEVRCGVVSVGADDMTAVLAKFGLSAPDQGLVELDRPRAMALLTQLIEVDLAYGTACTSHEEAGVIAETLLSEHTGPDSRYFSNGDGTCSWMPLTSSTFDAGLLVQHRPHVYFCVWFEEND